MRYKTLGDTTESIPVIGQGTMGIGGYLESGVNGDQKCIDAIRFGIDLGMMFIDTAENYGKGHSEEVIGHAIKSIREKVFIATKVAPEHLVYDEVIRACERSLRRLSTDYIDLYQIHWPNPAISIEETMEAMKYLKEQGKIRFIGVSNFSLQQIRESIEIFGKEGHISVQSEYNLFDRSIEHDILPFCEKNDLLTIAYSPLDQGYIAQDNSRIEILESIAQKYDRTRAQIVLNWLVSHPNMIAIPKAVNAEHIRQNAAAADFDIDHADIHIIDRTFQCKPIYVPTERIKVVVDGQGNRKVYQTIEDALKNPLGFTPSPSVLAEDIRKKNDVIKPVRVRKSSDQTGRYDYDLVEGRIRYWAWHIAHDGKRSIPVLVRP
ncbi:MAG: aldo/keto reductase [Deltaproteobacteria bacterium]|nr:aldo/keto reductase [Deltaproteobacteria bacterium]